MSLKNPKTLKKMLRKSSVSDAYCKLKFLEMMIFQRVLKNYKTE